MKLNRKKYLFLMCFLAPLLTGCQTDNVDSQVIDSSLARAAIEAENEKNYIAAVSHYRKLWGRQPSEKNLIGLARNMRYIGMTKEAVSLVGKNLSNYINSAPLHIEYGKSQLAAGDAAKSIGPLVQAIKLAPENWHIYSTLGIVYDQLKAFRNARNAYEMALTLSPLNSKILNNMAISAASAGDISEAIRIADKAARLDRSNVQIRQNLALFNGIKGHYGEAEALSRMDLDEESVRHNLSIYYSFNKEHSAKDPTALR